jgi:hypothetical protein
VFLLLCSFDYCVCLGITARTALSSPTASPLSLRPSLGVCQQGKPRARLNQRGIGRSSKLNEGNGNVSNEDKSNTEFPTTFTAATIPFSSSWRTQHYDTRNTMELLNIISLAQFAEEPSDWVNLWTNYPMVEPPARSPEEAQRRVTVSQLLQQGWNPTDGFQTSRNEILYIQEIARWSSQTKHHHHHYHPDTYGEVTELGARQLFHRMGLANHDENLITSSTITPTTITTTTASTNSEIEKKEELISKFRFYDLGSGVGRLVAQAYMELPQVDRIVGVELGPSRHQVALTGWNLIQTSAQRVRQCAAREELSKRLLVDETASADDDDDSSPCRLEFHEANLLDTDLSDATHVYLASLCFTEEMMADIAQKLILEAPRLQCVATLKEFPNPLALALLSSPPTTMEPSDTSSLLHHHQREPRIHRIEMTWTKPQGSGCVVYFYFPHRKVTARME